MIGVALGCATPAEGSSHSEGPFWIGRVDRKNILSHQADYDTKNAFDPAIRRVTCHHKNWAALEKSHCRDLVRYAESKPIVMVRGPAMILSYPLNNT